MSVTYDKYYQTADSFGAPYPELIEFFTNYPKGKLLDVGCGQGRDAIALARIGFEVIGIDNSKVGIDQLNLAAKKEGLNANGVVEDIYAYDHFQDFDVVLLDSMFHFEKRDREKETQLIEKIVKQLSKNASICVCIQDTGKKVKILKDTIDNAGIEFEILNDTDFIYIFEDKASGHKSETKYCMYIVKKK